MTDSMPDNQRDGGSNDVSVAQADAFVAALLAEARATGATLDVLGGFQNGRIELEKSDIDIICRTSADLGIVSELIARHLAASTSVRLGARRTWADNEQWVLRCGHVVFMLDLMAKLAFENIVLLEGDTYFELQNAGLDSRAIAQFLKHTTAFKKSGGRVPPRIASLTVKTPSRMERVRYLARKTRSVARSLLGHPNGLFAVILGPDGSGKSSVIDRLVRDLEHERAMIPVRRFHWRPQLRESTNWKANTEPHAVPPRGAGMSILKMGYLLGAFNAGYVARVMKPRHRFGIVLFDRYFDDLLVDPTRYRYSGPRFLAEAVASLVPRPDIWIILDASPELLHSRKQEVPLEETGRQRDAYRRLAETLPNAYVVDVSVPLDEVVGEVKTLLLEHLAAQSDAAEVPPVSPLLDRSPTAIEEHPMRAAYPNARLFLPIASPARDVAIPILSSGTKALLSRASSLTRGSTVRPTRIVREVARVAGFPNAETAVCLGAPGPWRKDVVLVIDGRDPVAVGKVAVTFEAAALLENESRWLGQLGASESIRGHVPRLIGAGTFEGQRFLVVSMLEGTRPGLTLSARILELTARIQTAVPATRGYHNSPMQLSLRELSCRLDTRMPSSWRRRVSTALEHVDDGLAPFAIPMVLAHRDFAPWNLRETATAVTVFDWEYARSGWLPLTDLFHYRLMPIVLERELGIDDARATIEDVSSALNEIDGGEDLRHAASVQLLAYLTDVASTFIDSHSGNVMASSRVVHRYAALIDTFTRWR